MVNIGKHTSTPRLLFSQAARAKTTQCPRASFKLGSGPCSANHLSHLLDWLLSKCDRPWGKWWNMYPLWLLDAWLGMSELPQHQAAPLTVISILNISRHCRFLYGKVHHLERVILQVGSSKQCESRLLGRTWGKLPFGKWLGVASIQIAPKNIKKHQVVRWSGLGYSETTAWLSKAELVQDPLGRSGRRTVLGDPMQYSLSICIQGNYRIWMDMI